MKLKEKAAWGKNKGGGGGGTLVIPRNVGNTEIHCADKMQNFWFLTWWYTY